MRTSDSRYPLIILQDLFCLIISSLINSGCPWRQGSAGCTCRGFPGRDLNSWACRGLPKYLLLASNINQQHLCCPCPDQPGGAQLLPPLGSSQPWWDSGSVSPCQARVIPSNAPLQPHPCSPGVNPQLVMLEGFPWKGLRKEKCCGQTEKAALLVDLMC